MVITGSVKCLGQCVCTVTQREALHIRVFAHLYWLGSACVRACVTEAEFSSLVQRLSFRVETRANGFRLEL